MRLLVLFDFFDMYLHGFVLPVTFDLTLSVLHLAVDFRMCRLRERWHDAPGLACLAKTSQA